MSAVFSWTTTMTNAGFTEQELRRRDRIKVKRDGEEIDVYNWVNVKTYHVIRPGMAEEFDPEIGAGDSSTKPEAVTPWLAEMMWAQVGHEAEAEGIEVIDPTDDGVTVL